MVISDVHTCLPKDIHGHAISSMFNRIASWYDFINHFVSFGLDRGWRRELVRLVSPGPTGRILDLAAGTLDVSLELLHLHSGLHVLAMDFSIRMLQLGKIKIPSDQRRNIHPVLADGRAIPLPTACVDAVTIAFGIRNIQPRCVALSEICRVLVPTGQLYILEFCSSRRKIFCGFYNFYLRYVVPALGHTFSGDGDAYRYLSISISDFPDITGFAAELEAVGFYEINWRPLLGGIVYFIQARRS